MCKCSSYKKPKKCESKIYEKIEYAINISKLEIEYKLIPVLLYLFSVGDFSLVLSIFIHELIRFFSPVPVCRLPPFLPHFFHNASPKVS